MLTIVLGDPHEGPSGGPGLEVLLKIELSDELVDGMGGVLGVASAIYQGLQFGSKYPIDDVTRPVDDAPAREPVGAIPPEELDALLAKAGE